MGIRAKMRLENVFAQAWGGAKAIFRCEYGRSWLRRMLVYWFVLTVGPLVLGLAPVVLSKADAVMNALSLWAWLGVALRLLLSLGIFWLR